MGRVRMWCWRALSALGSIWFVAVFFPLYGTLSAGQILGVAAILTGLGYVTDRVLLSRWNGLVAAVFDFFFAWAAVYGLSFLFPGTPVTATFALLCGWLYAFTELLVHRGVYRKEKWEGPDRADARKPGP
ncbi:MAG: DUF2512 family protein [Alicyclobacillaceae bacterium]|nr:DUF2512 family protein [Alicyclobacillaceae bacterium]